MSEEDQGDRSLPQKKELDSQQLVLFDQTLQVERERIQSQDRRTEVMMRALEIGNASDERQFQFHMENLSKEERLENKRLSLAGKIASGIGICSIGVIAILVYMLFFGSEPQAGRARELILWVFNALGGGGVLFVLVRAIQWLMRKN